MGEVPDYPTAEIGASSTTEEILAAIAAEEPHGATADQIARTLGLGINVEPVQDELEEMVRRGEVDRRGIGLGAVYTLAAGM